MTGQNVKFFAGTLQLHAASTAALGLYQCTLSLRSRAYLPPILQAYWRYEQSIWLMRTSSSG
jgi:hypothetical protein